VHSGFNLSYSYSNTVATNKPQTLNSLNGNVFKRYKNNKIIGLDYSRTMVEQNTVVEPASRSNTGHLFLQQHLQNLQA